MHFLEAVARGGDDLFASFVDGADLGALTGQLGLELRDALACLARARDGLAECALDRSDLVFIALGTGDRKGLGDRVEHRAADRDPDAEQEQPREEGHDREELGCGALAAGHQDAAGDFDVQCADVSRGRLGVQEVVLALRAALEERHVAAHVTHEEGAGRLLTLHEADRWAGNGLEVDQHARIALTAVCEHNAAREATDPATLPGEPILARARDREPRRLAHVAVRRVRLVSDDGEQCLALAVGHVEGERALGALQDADAQRFERLTRCARLCLVAARCALHIVRQPFVREKRSQEDLMVTYA